MFFCPSALKSLTPTPSRLSIQALNIKVIKPTMRVFSSIHPSLVNTNNKLGFNLHDKGGDTNKPDSRKGKGREQEKDTDIKVANVLGIDPNTIQDKLNGVYKFAFWKDFVV
ncbi:hypothetical protein BDZ94DRAFT_1315474 [Collybia nuda]|uniref:Uncharacterized protein n=1 Tax=Collybia nuda TaxID=64659 RepID=A0A9P6CCI5_9AGAR|nr:hypothetical protein BDZ94DRAFT_1315474 [Collybia nuda]